MCDKCQTHQVPEGDPQAVVTVGLYVKEDGSPDCSVIEVEGSGVAKAVVADMLLELGTELYLAARRDAQERALDAVTAGVGDEIEAELRAAADQQDGE